MISQYTFRKINQSNPNDFQLPVIGNHIIFTWLFFWNGIIWEYVFLTKKNTFLLFHTISKAHMFEMRKIENHTNYFVSFLFEYEFI